VAFREKAAADGRLFGQLRGFMLRVVQAVRQWECLLMESGEQMKTIYVGNLPFSASESEIEALFAQHGNVHSVKLINDRETGRPRGFGFVEMEAAGADKAIEALDGKDFGGRNLRVNEAQERKPSRPPRRF